MTHTGEKTCFVVLPGLAPDALPIEPLKQRLEAAGHLVIASNFWGREPVSDFSTLTIAQCLRGVGLLIEEAKTRSSRVVGIGVSLGGALLLEHAKQYGDLASIISIGTPFRLRTRPFFAALAAIAPYVNPLWKILDRIRSLRLPPLGIAPSVLEYLEGDFLLGLERISTPVVFLHSKLDTVTDYRAVAGFASRLPNPLNRVDVLNNGDHVINYDADVIMRYV